MNFRIVRRLRIPGLNETRVGPGLPRMAVNFARASARQAVHITRGREPFVSDEQAAANLAVCRACPDGMFEPGRVRCLDPRCGCFLKHKTRWATAGCPRGHWNNLKRRLVFQAAREKVTL